MNALEKMTLVISESAIIREEVVGNGNLVYRLMKSNVLLDQQPVCIYGMQILSTLFQHEESETLTDISSDFLLVNELFELAVRNFVLPCTFREITYDFLVDKY